MKQMMKQLQRLIDPSENWSPTEKAIDKKAEKDWLDNYYNRLSVDHPLRQYPELIKRSASARAMVVLKDGQIFAELTRQYELHFTHKSENDSKATRTKYLGSNFANLAEVLHIKTHDTKEESGAKRFRDQIDVEQVSAADL